LLRVLHIELRGAGFIGGDQFATKQEYCYDHARPGQRHWAQRWTAVAGQPRSRLRDKKSTTARGNIFVDGARFERSLETSIANSLT
jgi:hypothetical protein